MYTQQAECQTHTYQKTLHYQSFLQDISKKPFLTLHDHPFFAVKEFRGKAKQIYEYIFGFRNLPFIELLNETIAKKVNCSVRTVQRWTRIFEQKGIMTKMQSSIYGPNMYALHITEQAKKEYVWQDSLCVTYRNNAKKELKLSFLPETVTPSYSSLNILDNIYIKPSPSTRVRALGARARTRKEFFKNNPRRNRILRGLGMLKKEQKEWIRSNKGKSNIAEFVMSDKVKPLLFTQSIEELTKLLSLNERERLKLVAFPDEALDYCLQETKNFFQRKTDYTIRDVLSWLLSTALRFCSSNQITPDWRFYYDLCEILNLEKLGKNQEPRALVYKKPVPKRNTDGHSPMVKKVQTNEQKIHELVSSIQGYREQLGDITKHFGHVPSFLQDSLITMTKTLLEKALFDLNELTISETIH